jgi:hypothetical protein
VADRRTSPLRPLLALATVLGLAACSAGVPQTGEVVSVSPVTSTAPSVNPEIPQDVGGPRSGQSESEVAVGFMNAMNSGDVTRIQRWVMPEARGQVAAWSKPTTTVRVYSVFEPGTEYLSEDDRRVVPIKVRLVGQLRGGRDWYPATGDDLLSLELDKDGADARVANPGPVIWMRDVAFSKLYASAELYLAPDLTDPTPQLAPVPVFVPSGGGDPEAPELRVKRAVELLLAGPQDRYRHLGTAIPGGTELKSIHYAKDVVTLNFNKRFTEEGGSGQLRMGELVWTVNRLLPNASIRVQVDGHQVAGVGSDQFPANRRWSRNDAPLDGMWPQRSSDRQDDSILFVRGGEIFTIAPEAGQAPRPVVLDAPSPKAAPTWSPDHRSMAFLAGGGTAQALWVESDGEAFRATPELAGRLSPPSWSPDSKRVYLVRRDDAGARLIEVTRRTLHRRVLELPPLPSGLQPASIAVSPDGAFVLAVAERPGRKLEEAEPVPGGELFLGQFGPDGVVGWSQRQIAPGVGRVFSPVWVDPVTVGFIAETDNRDDLGRLWTIKSDGWDPTQVLNNSDVPIGDIGNHLAVDPTGSSFVITARSSNGASLWMVDREDKSVSDLTLPSPNDFDTDPNFASR